MILAAAMVLDAILGEPKWLWDRAPHPAVLMGRLIGWADDRFNKGNARRFMGAATVIEAMILVAVIGWVISWLGWPFELIAVAVLLAQKSLVTHVRDVADGLRLGLGDGRAAVARIVGRDVATLDKPGVARAAIESAAENLSDGVVAPIFWYLVAGLPGMLAYKMLNTADSMIGYRTDRHEEFGWAAAKLDDLANWIPARLTAVMIALVTSAYDRFGIIRTESRHHRSPNAGWPEAAMAYGLDISLSGPRMYHGEPTDDPFINADGARQIGAEEVEASIIVLWKVWAICLVCALLGGLI